MRVMKFAEVLDESLEVVKKNAGTILMYNLIYGLIYIGACIILGIFIASFAMAAIMSGASEIGVIVGIGMVFFFFAVLWLSQMAGNIKIGQHYLNQEKTTSSNALKEAFKKLPTLAGILFWYGLCIAPLALISYKIVYEFLGGSHELLLRSGDWLAVIVFTIIVLAIFLTFIFATNFFAFAIHAAVLENTGPIKSITRSFKLVKTQFWRVLGAMFLIQLLIAGIQYSLLSFLGYCVGILYLISQFLNFGPEELYQIGFGLGSYLQWPISILNYLFLNSWLMIMITLLYINIRFKTEGYDLILRINQLERNIEIGK